MDQQLPAGFPPKWAGRVRALITFVLPHPRGLFLVDTFVFIGISCRYNSITCLLWSRLKIQKCGRKENISHGSRPRLSHGLVFFPCLHSLVITTAAGLLIDVALSPLFEQLSGGFLAPLSTGNLEVRRRRAWTKTAWLGKGTGGP